MVKIEQEKFLRRAEERSPIYGLLSGVYRKEPTQEFLKSLRSLAFLALFDELGIALGKDFKSRDLTRLANEFAIEYTRLFVGPGKHIYPYESAYRDQKGPMGADTAIQIKDLIESSGLQYKLDFHGSFDHISVELEFMQKIVTTEAESWRGNDHKKAMRLLEFEKQFIDDHLIKWIPEFSDRVIEQARLSFYREMAKLTRGYILLEAREAKDLIERVRTQVE